MKQIIQIRCKNNKKTLNIEIGSTLSEVFDKLNIDMPYGPISAKVNNKVEGMHFRLYHNKDIEFLDMHSSSGSRAYTRTLFFVLCKAVHDLYPDGSVVIDIPVSNGYYCDLKIGRAVTTDDCNNLRRRMEQIIAAAIPITRHEAPTEDVMKMFATLGTHSKVELLRTSGRLYTTYYDIDGYVDYFYGTLLTNTSQLYLFGLEKYYDGLLLRIPSPQNAAVLGKVTRQDKMFEIFKEHHRWQDILGMGTVGAFNAAVEGGLANSIVNVSEALQEKKIAHIAEQIAARQGVKMVLIAGPSSSGKTTTCKRLSIQLLTCGIRPVPISLDDYFVDREQTPRQPNGDYDYESIHALNLPLLNSQLAALFNGEEVARRRARGGRHTRPQPRTHGTDTRRPEVPRLRIGTHHHTARHPQLHPHDRQPPAATHHTRLQIPRLLGTRHHTSLAQRARWRKQVDIPLSGKRRRDVQHCHDLRAGGDKKAGRPRARSRARKLRRICRSLPSTKIPQLLPRRRLRQTAAHIATTRIPRRQHLHILTHTCKRDNRHWEEQESPFNKARAVC